MLLVEDNPGDVRLLRETLAEADPGRFELTRASTLSEGLERLTEGGIDVGLLDLSLPDAQGLEAIVRVQAQAPGVPFIVLTGRADETLAVAALREGTQDYLIKGQLDRSLLVRSMQYAWGPMGWPCSERTWTMGRKLFARGKIRSLASWESSSAGCTVYWTGGASTNGLPIC